MAVAEALSGLPAMQEFHMLNNPAVSPATVSFLRASAAHVAKVDF